MDTDGDNGREFHTLACKGMIGMFIVAFLMLTIGGQKALYGRYTTTEIGPTVNGRIDWIGHGTSLVAAGYIYLYKSEPACISSLANNLLLALFCLHYVNRSIVFTMTLSNPKPIPVVLLCSTSGFCLFNGYLQATYLCNYYVYPEEWMYSPQFLVGTTLFLTGSYINITSDRYLISLKKKSKNGAYLIPRHGLFNYVSGANFFGEIIEWTGFAIACWSLPAFAFAFATFANLSPRARHHHLYYIEKFDEYPKERCAIIPFIW